MERQWLKKIIIVFLVSVTILAGVWLYTVLRTGSVNNTPEGNAVTATSTSPTNAFLDQTRVPQPPPAASSSKPTEPKANTISWQIFTDPTYGYNVSYPGTWTLRDSRKYSGSPTNNYEQRNIDSPEHGDEVFSVVMRVYYDKNTLPVEDWYAKTLQGKEFPQFYPTPILATTSVTIAGLPGMEAFASFNGFTFREYFVTKNNLVYSIYLTNNGYTLQKDIDAANTVLSKLTIN
ncbi:MAG: hypothetical protein KGJ89_01460 [Patescibacteria group bacterium]|nr:hypothetical protein [Patescibacteria group bacterium]MDE2015180.1 hypothetical protein [Patescibacteria group bacterium]MDE2226608.1 hypothetical protein [Patescibacteria group bacterium]